jgi:hypothetical protein
MRITEQFLRSAAATLLLYCFLVPAANAQRTVTLYGVAKIDLASGLYIGAYDDGYYMKDAYILSFSKEALEGNNWQSLRSPVAFVTKKDLSKSESRWSTQEWVKRRVAYYKSMFRDNKVYTQKQLAGDAGKSHVIVDYEMKYQGKTYRDYTKYIRAAKTTEVQAWYTSSSVGTWNDDQPERLRAAVASLRPLR